MNNAADTLTADLTRDEASRVLIDAVGPHECGIRSVACDVDEIDGIVWWTAEVFDPYAPEGEDTLGSASFAEHWPEVEITWS